MTNKNDKNRINRKSGKPVNRQVDSNNRSRSKAVKNAKPMANNGLTNNRKKSNKALYLVYALAGVALILLVFTIIQFMKGDTTKPEEDVTKAAKTTTTTSATQVEEGIAFSIYFGDICLGGMEYADFDKQITEKSSELLKNIRINLENEKDDNNEKQSSFSALALGIKFNTEEIYKKAEELNELIKQKPTNEANLFLQVVRAGTVENDTVKVIGNNDKIAELADVEGDKYQLHPVFLIDEAALKKAVEEFSEEVEIKPQKSVATAFNLETLQFEFGEGSTGYKLDTNSLTEKLKQAFSENKLSESVKLEFIESNEIEDNDVEFGLRGSGITNLVSYDPARDSNVRRVAELLSGIVIQPGEEFSYWTAINPISVENGYTYGGAIAADGTVESVIGGGVCQGSSTLYLAAVRADLAITERNNHTIPSAYAIEGIDAMVSDWSDLKFANNTEHPIAIVGYYIDSTSIEFQIYGEKLPEGVTIDLDPHFVSQAAAKAPNRVVNKNLKPGEEVVVRNGIIGSYWSTDKVYYKDGVEFDRVHFNNSYYWSYAGTIEYNPDPPSSTTTTTTTESSTSETTTAPSTSETTTAPTTSATPAPVEQPAPEPPAPAPEPPAPAPAPEQPAPAPEPTP